VTLAGIITKKARKQCNKMYERDFEEGRVYPLRLILKSLGKDKNKNIPCICKDGVSIGGTVYKYESDLSCDNHSFSLLTKLRAAACVNPGRQYKETVLSEDRYSLLFNETDIILNLNGAKSVSSDIRLNMFRILTELKLLKGFRISFRESVAAVEPRGLFYFLKLFQPDKLGFWYGTWDGTKTRKRLTDNVEAVVFTGEGFRYICCVTLK
jgi:hypothetical protein